jgi:hypothetical protein
LAFESSTLTGKGAVRKGGEWDRLMMIITI